MTQYANAGRVLVVDDEPGNVALIRRLMESRDYEVVSAADGEAGLEEVRRARPDIILLDVNMPRLGGLDVCRRLKGDPATRFIPIVLLTGLDASSDRVQGINAGADDFLSKPFVVDELLARVRSLTKLKRYTDELESAEAMIRSLALTIEARDPYTRGHCERLAGYATSLGARLGLSEDQQTALHRGGFLHDVGKIGVRDAVLLKPGALNPSERELMEAHPVIGDNLCSELHMLKDVRPIVRHHHERADGSGYPDNLAGDDIPLLAQIVSVVDAYDAMTTDRPYKTAVQPGDACRELRQDVARGWKSAALVEEFVSLIQTT